MGAQKIPNGYFSIKNMMDALLKEYGLERSENRIREIIKEHKIKPLPLYIDVQINGATQLRRVNHYQIEAIFIIFYKTLPNINTRTPKHDSLYPVSALLSIIKNKHNLNYSHKVLIQKLNRHGIMPKKIKTYLPHIGQTHIVNHYYYKDVLKVISKNITENKIKQQSNSIQVTEKIFFIPPERKIINNTMSQFLLRKY